VTYPGSARAPPLVRLSHVTSRRKLASGKEVLVEVEVEGEGEGECFGGRVRALC
jgi:hypothetical protein